MNECQYDLIERDQESERGSKKKAPKTGNCSNNVYWSKLQTKQLQNNLAQCAP